MTHDIDRTRLTHKAQQIIRGILELESLAIAGATQHERQLDALRDELAKAADAPVDMTIGLDDIRELLLEAGQDNPAIGALLVEDGDEVQVVDSIHAIVDTLVQRDGLVVALQDSRNRAKADRDRAIQAAADNAAAEADHAAELAQDLHAAVDGLVDAIASLNRPSAKLAKLSNPIGALRIVTEVVKDVARQVLDGIAGERPMALALSLADADQLEEQISAIEAVCEAAGMPATVERADIPAWLAEHLTTRAEKKAKAKKDVVFKDDAGGPWVIMRNDANGRRWFLDLAAFNGLAWDVRLSEARRYDTEEDAATHKPRGSKVVTLLEAQRLVENDARVAASAALPFDDGASNG